MIFGCETFGNTDNPFNEPVDEELRWRVTVEPSRGLTRQQIKLMQARYRDVQTEQFGDEKYTRQLQFTCRAPYSIPHHMFINEAAVTTDIEQLSPLMTRIARVTIGDTYVDGVVVRRWSSLEDADDLPFTASGLGNRLPRRGRGQLYDRLTVVTGSENAGQPNTQVWGQLAGEEATSVIPETDATRFAAHYEALYKAVSSQVEKLK